MELFGKRWLLSLTRLQNAEITWQTGKHRESCRISAFPDKFLKVILIQNYSHFAIFWPPISIFRKQKWYNNTISWKISSGNLEFWMGCRYHMIFFFFFLNVSTLSFILSLNGINNQDLWTLLVTFLWIYAVEYKISG